ncbi:MAG TPA: DUF309 domain-containing protein [Elusimicrobiota bacterium]|nr:DUF309 domain-containing protein [Elusimicrobiota bacterium]
MAEARFLIRLGNTNGYRPSDGGDLLRKLRASLAGHDARAMNLRVSSRAVEFDLFTGHESPRAVLCAGWRSIGPVVTERRLDVPGAPRTLEEAMLEARALFEEERFWEVHESLEEAWRRSAGGEKEWLQGLILLAAALVHHQRREPSVAWPMMADALHRLAKAPASAGGWNLAELRDRFQTVFTSKTLDFPSEL